MAEQIGFEHRLFEEFETLGDRFAGLGVFDLARVVPQGLEGHMQLGREIGQHLDQSRAAQWTSWPKSRFPIGNQLQDRDIFSDRGPVVEHEHRSEGHTSELQSLMRTPYDVLCLKRKN